MEKYHDQHEKSDVDDFLSQLDEKPSKSNIGELKDKSTDIS